MKILISFVKYYMSTIGDYYINQLMPTMRTEFLITYFANCIMKLFQKLKFLTTKKV